MAWLLTLLVVVVGDGPAPGPLKPELAAIQEAQQRASDRYHQGYEAAKTEVQREQAVADYLTQVNKHSDQALELARRQPDDPAALDALIFVIRTARAGPSDHSEQAITLLNQARYLRDARIGAACQWIIPFFHSPAAEALIRAVLDQNPDPQARGLACYSLAQYLKYQAHMLRRFREDPAMIADYEGSRGAARIKALQMKDPGILTGEAAMVLDRVVAEFSSVPYDQRTLGAVAAGALIELRDLQAGRLAPEIDGTDVDGRRFRLSDYRGKVVVLTFSGNWCGPCRAMYPHERELVARLKDKPFALVSVNTDEDPATLRKAIEAGEITWRCWSERGSEGPIVTNWGVSGFPTIYVLDPLGVIRFPKIRADQLDQAVETLMREGTR